MRRLQERSLERVDEHGVGGHQLGATTAIDTATINSIQFNFMCIALNHLYRLKGLNRPSVYDTPP